MEDTACALKLCPIQGVVGLDLQRGIGEAHHVHNLVEYRGFQPLLPKMLDVAFNQIPLTSSSTTRYFKF